MKAWHIIGLMAVNPLFLMAQNLQYVSSSRAVVANTETTDTQTAKPAVKNLHLMPLFGETSKSTEQIEQEIRFLNDCDQNFASREEASQFFSERAWDYLRDNELDTACYRFNLAWLLNPKNVECYWGLGVVCYKKNHFTDAERMLRKGVDLDSSNVGLLVDLATVDLLHFKASKEAWELTEAEQILNHAIRLDTNNANAYLKKSVLEFHKCNYDAAWTNLHKTRLLNIELLDYEFMSELIAQKPDPLGIFKGEK